MYIWALLMAVTLCFGAEAKDYPDNGVVLGPFLEHKTAHAKKETLKDCLAEFQQAKAFLLLQQEADLAFQDKVIEWAKDDVRKTEAEVAVTKVFAASTEVRQKLKDAFLTRRMLLSKHIREREAMASSETRLEADLGRAYSELAAAAARVERVEREEKGK
jgi:hypothetical protein